MTIKIENIIAIASFIVFPSLINFKYREYFIYRTIINFSVVSFILVVSLFQPVCGRGDILVELFNFILSVVASVVGYYICKWLDGDE